ncbi:MAG: hypothetical protein CFH30_01018 [Alphaproteobacteria bacterium MarineAlpha8_Bin1]|nr:MAG: hypothetical protein CFH30_01018 [Alphaproteobacteria bacterium MarineAlpha8_Bin1]|tara:strand:+ start:1243 stop:1929 length:687 start_codon:yes stop_codon:yes gene_type:complete
MNNIPFFDILILAMIAVFIINRLRNTLGKKTGNESDIVKKYSIDRTTSFKESVPDEISSNTSNTLNKKDLNKKLHSNPKINSVLSKICQYNNDFSLESFIDGAKKAFEYIIKSYSQDKIDSLKKLVSKDMLDIFSTEIKNRKKRKQSLDITLIGIEKPEITKAEITSKNLTKITLKFITEQIQITKNSKGEIIEGDSNQILSITEFWTFSKKITNKDPNWTLEEIQES